MEKESLTLFEKKMKILKKMKIQKLKRHFLLF